MMNRGTLLIFGIGLSALVQARILPEIGLDTTINLPLLVVLLLSSARRRSALVAGAFIAGLLIDTLLWRPLGVTALNLIAGILVATIIRGNVDASWARRGIAALAGYAAAFVALTATSDLLGVGTTEQPPGAIERLLLNIGLLVLGSVVGARRREQQLRERPLDARSN